MEREPGEEVRAILYRITREALANVRRHAGARRVAVTIEERGRGYLVRVRDDGGGLPTAALRGEPTPGHFGLGEMRDRAELAGGWWNVRNEPAGGSVVEFWLPEEPQGDSPAA